METFIKGEYKRSIYQSDNGFTVGILKIRETNCSDLEDYVNKNITFTGTIFDLVIDDKYLFYGEVQTHPRYGFQFQVTSFERAKPEERDGIIEFLSSDLFKGVGEKLATNIVETLGDDALTVILENVEDLMMVPKMTAKKAKDIHDALVKYEESHTTIVYLNELGFAMRDSLSIYNKYRGDTVRNITYNPYQLVYDIEDISFDKVDRIRESLKIEMDDERRVKALILNVMDQICFDNGNTFLDFLEIGKALVRRLSAGIEEDVLVAYLRDLVDDDKIVVMDDRYYLRNYFDAENNISDKIRKLVSRTNSQYKKLDEYVEQVEEMSRISYNPQQKEAIKRAVEDNFLIITGGPGTGKTTIIKAIVEIYRLVTKSSFEQLVYQMAMLAPTGRAAKRMSEATKLPATTIHRFLKWNKDTNDFKINEDNKSDKKFIIIDEVSMIDTKLLDSLLSGLNNNIKLILVGDYNQLPSVGPGQILKDLIGSDVVDTIKLDTLYRQSEDSYIITLANAIKDDSLGTGYREKRSDYNFINCDEFQLNENIKFICSKKTDIDCMNTQVLVPMYKGLNGIDQLNKILQEIFNPPDPTRREYAFGDVVFRERDKILQLVNMPDDNVYNGDIGVIEEIVPATIALSKKNEIYVRYDDNVVLYTPKDLINIKHGYAISIHKSQGSEFDTIIMPISKSYGRMLYQKLIYTGVTRAKKRLILIGNPSVFEKGVATKEVFERKTSLKTMLIEKILEV